MIGIGLVILVAGGEEGEGGDESGDDGGGEGDEGSTRKRI